MSKCTNGTSGCIHNQVKGKLSIILLAEASVLDNACNARTYYLEKQVEKYLEWASEQKWYFEGYRAFVETDTINVLEEKFNHKTHASLSERQGDIEDYLLDAQNGLDIQFTRLDEEAIVQDEYWTAVEKGVSRAGASSEGQLHWFKARLWTLQQELAYNDKIQDVIDQVLPLSECHLKTKNRTMIFIRKCFERIDHLLRDKKVDYLFWYSISHQLFDKLGTPDNARRMPVLKFEGILLADRISHYERKMQELKDTLDAKSQEPIEEQLPAEDYLNLQAEIWG